MSKLSRTVLKEIVKECIIEIFEESFFTQGSMLHENNNKSYASNDQKNEKRRRQRRPASSNTSRRSSLDSISYGGSQNDSNKKSVMFEQKVDRLTSNLTDDPIMANIFKDTASTTLQQQNGATSGRGMGVPLSGGGDAAAYKASNSDPTELFAESAGKWASLAFADPIKK